MSRQRKYISGLGIAFIILLHPLSGQQSTWQQITEMGNHAMGAQDHVNGRKYYEMAWDVAQTFVPYDLRRATSLRNLANGMASLGWYADADSLYALAMKSARLSLVDNDSYLVALQIDWDNLRAVMAIEITERKRRYRSLSWLEKLEAAVKWTFTGITWEVAPTYPYGPALGDSLLVGIDYVATLYIPSGTSPVPLLLRRENYQFPGSRPSFPSYTIRSFTAEIAPEIGPFMLHFGGGLFRVTTGSTTWVPAGTRQVLGANAGIRWILAGSHRRKTTGMHLAISANGSYVLDKLYDQPHNIMLFRAGVVLGYSW